MARQPAFRKISGIKNSADFDQAAGSKSRSIIEQKSKASGGKSGGGGGGIMGKVMGGLASHETGDMVDSGGAANPEGDPLMVPGRESQSALHTTAAGPAYTPGSLMGILTGNKTGEQNPGFNPEKPIGGENVPYKETTGLGGWFKRIAGDKSNQLNAEAQGQQATEWKSEEAAKKREAREDARDMNKFNQQLARDTNADEERRVEREADMKMRAEDRDATQRRWAADTMGQIGRDEQADIDRNLARAATKEQNDRMYNLANNADTRAAAKLTAEQTAEANKINYHTDKDGNAFATKGGTLYQYTKPQRPFGTPGSKNFIPGVMGGWQPVNLGGAPGAGMSAGGGDPQVDPATGKPHGGGGRNPAGFMQSGNSIAIPNAMEVKLPIQKGSLNSDGLLETPAESTEPPFGPPQLMDQYNMRAKELTSSGGAMPTESAMYPLSGPLNRKIASYLNVQPEQVGASRFSRTPESVVSRDQDKYLTEFGQLPLENQEDAVNQALIESYKNPKARKPAFGWQYQ
jgi:hypothetical protein